MVLNFYMVSQTIGLISRNMPSHDSYYLVNLFQKPKPSNQNETVKAPRPPADPNRPISRKGSRHRLQHSSSQDIPSGDLESVKTRSGSLQDGKLYP